LKDGSELWHPSLYSRRHGLFATAYLRYVLTNPPRARGYQIRRATSNQLALALREEVVVAAAVWETLPAEAQQQVTLKLARLLARLLEAERDE
jgi:hypothetical protein